MALSIYPTCRMQDQVKPALPWLPRAVSRWLEKSFLRTAFGNYRPERHYMRGSGPKSANTGEAADFQTNTETNRHQLGVTNG